MRYFGFDLGDGESCVALYSDQHIAPIILPVHGRNSFITALARYDGHPVVGALASDNPRLKTSASASSATSAPTAISSTRPSPPSQKAS